MSLRVPIALLLLSFAAATAYETAGHRDAPPGVCLLPLEESKVPRCAVPPAEAERAS